MLNIRRWWGKQLGLKCLHGSHQAARVVCSLIPCAGAITAWKCRSRGGFVIADGLSVRIGCRVTISFAEEGSGNNVHFKKDGGCISTTSLLNAPS